MTGSGVLAMYQPGRGGKWSQAKDVCDGRWHTLKAAVEEETWLFSSTVLQVVEAPAEPMTGNMVPGPLVFGGLVERRLAAMERYRARFQAGAGRPPGSWKLTQAWTRGRGAHAGQFLLSVRSPGVPTLWRPHRNATVNHDPALRLLHQRGTRLPGPEGCAVGGPRIRVGGGVVRTLGNRRRHQTWRDARWANAERPNQLQSRKS